MLKVNYGVINTIQEIGRNNHDYSIIRVKTFIPFDKVEDPRASTPLSPFVNHLTSHGDDREFNIDSTAVRTYQYIVANLTNKTVNGANYVGQTIVHDEDEIEYRGYSPLSGFSMSYEVKGDFLFVNAKVAAPHPIISNAPDIDYDINFTFKGGSLHHMLRITDGFPAYEIYQSTNGNPYVTLDKIMPQSGDNIWDIFPWRGNRVIDYNY